MNTSRRSVSKGAVSIALLSTIMIVAIVSPAMISDSLANKINIAARLTPPSLSHPLGTDQLGREILFRVMLGSQLSLAIAAASVFVSFCIGLPIGMISGFYRGGIDNVSMRLIDALLAFPALLLALTISAVLGPNVQNTVLAIGVAYAPIQARVVRGEVLRITQLPFVEAARACGTKDIMLMIRHIFPNVVPQIIVQVTISLAFAILAEAGLSFLGLGTQPPNSSWGLMIQSSRDYLDSAPWMALVPGGAVALTVLGLNALGGFLRDFLDPRAKA